MTGTLGHGPPLVIIGEPNPQHAQCIWQALESSFQLIWTKTIDETLQAALVNHPQVIVIEIAWPDGNGFDLLQQLVAWRNAPILIVMTRINTLEAKARASLIGADSVYIKDNDTLSYWQSTFAKRLLMRLYVARINGGWRNPLFRTADVDTQNAAVLPE